MGTKYGACVETGRRFRVSRYFQNQKETLEKNPNTKQKTLLRAVWAEPEETFPFRHPCVVMLRKADIRIMKLM